MSNSSLDRGCQQCDQNACGYVSASLLQIRAFAQELPHAAAGLLRRNAKHRDLHSFENLRSSSPLTNLLRNSQEPRNLLGTY